MAKDKATALGGAGGAVSLLTRFLLEILFNAKISGMFPLGRRHLDALLKSPADIGVYFRDMRAKLIDQIDLARKAIGIIAGSETAFINTWKDARNYRMSSGKIRSMLGFQCRYTLDEGIALLLDRVRQNCPDCQGSIYYSRMYWNYERADGGPTRVLNCTDANTVAPWSSRSVCLPGPERRAWHKRLLSGESNCR